MEYVGAEWSSDRMTRNPFLSLCSVNLTLWAIAAGMTNRNTTITAEIVCLLISFIKCLEFSGSSLHPIDAFDELLMHHRCRLMRAAAIAPQEPPQTGGQQKLPSIEGGLSGHGRE